MKKPATEQAAYIIHTSMGNKVILCNHVTHLQDTRACSTTFNKKLLPANFMRRITQPAKKPLYAATTDPLNSSELIALYLPFMNSSTTTICLVVDELAIDVYVARESLISTQSQLYRKTWNVMDRDTNPFTMA